jgi:hypothetical protein
MQLGSAEVTVLVRGHPEGQRLVAPLARLHSLPPQVMQCPLCEYPGTTELLSNEPLGPA